MSAPASWPVAEAGSFPATWRSLLSRATGAVGPGDARRILERASGYGPAEMHGHLDEVATQQAAAHVAEMLRRRAAGEPLQYVVGRWGFRRLEVMVDRRVLIPRPETEEVAGVAIDRLRRGPVAAGRLRRLVDLGTGSGAIALAVADEVADAEVWATDASTEALAVARANLAGMGRRGGSRVRLVEGDWYGALPAELAGTVDVVASNPPYVAGGEALPEEVAAWEPPRALYSGPTGLESLERVVSEAVRWLSPGGWLVVEIAPHQRRQVLAMAGTAGLVEAEVHQDLAGRYRVLVARRAE